MNNKTKKLALAVLAAAALSGCSSMQVTALAQPDAPPAALPKAEDVKVMRALPSYGTLGGYRYRRFAAVAVSG